MNGAFADSNGNTVMEEQRSKSQSEERGLRITSDIKPDSPLTVILFGWAGCRDRYLAKYAQVYGDKGISTIRFTAPIAKVRSFDTYRTLAAQFYEHVWKNHGLGSPVLFHVFSMNGCSLFTALWELLGTIPEGEQVKKNTRGVIFDSSPANVTPLAASHAIAIATLPPSKYHASLRHTYRAIVLGFFSAHRALIWLRSHFDSSIYEKSLAFFCLMNMKDLPHRQLYIFSKVDEICHHESIEHFALVQREVGKDTILAKFEESAHCEHLRHDPDSYTNLCLEFLKKDNLLSS